MKETKCPVFQHAFCKCHQQDKYANRSCNSQRYPFLPPFWLSISWKLSVPSRIKSQQPSFSPRLLIKFSLMVGTGMGTKSSCQPHWKRNSGLNECISSTITFLYRWWDGVICIKGQGRITDATVHAERGQGRNFFCSLGRQRNWPCCVFCLANTS